MASPLYCKCVPRMPLAVGEESPKHRRPSQSTARLPDEIHCCSVLCYQVWQHVDRYGMNILLLHLASLKHLYLSLGPGDLESQGFCHLQCLENHHQNLLAVTSCVLTVTCQHRAGWMAKHPPTPSCAQSIAISYRQGTVSILDIKYLILNSPREEMMAHLVEMCTAVWPSYPQQQQLGLNGRLQMAGGARFTQPFNICRLLCNSMMHILQSALALIEEKITWN